MPKPFVIGVEVEEVALGQVLRRLNSMPGIVALHMDFDSKPKPNGKGGNRRGRFEQSGHDALLEILKRQDTAMTMAEMRHAFKALGRAGSSLSSVHHSLRKGGLLISAGRGKWKLSAKARE